MLLLLCVSVSSLLLLSSVSSLLSSLSSLSSSSLSVSVLASMPLSLSLSLSLPAPAGLCRNRFANELICSALLAEIMRTARERFCKMRRIVVLTLETIISLIMALNWSVSIFKFDSGIFSASSVSHLLSSAFSRSRSLPFILLTRVSSGSEGAFGALIWSIGGSETFGPRSSAVRFSIIFKTMLCSCWGKDSSKMLAPAG